MKEYRLISSFLTAVLLFATGSILWITLRALNFLPFEWTLILPIMATLTPSYAIFTSFQKMFATKTLQPSTIQMEPADISRLRTTASELEEKLNKTREELEATKASIQKVKEEPEKQRSQHEKLGATPIKTVKSEYPEISKSSQEDVQVVEVTKLQEDIKTLIATIRKVKSKLEILREPEGKR